MPHLITKIKNKKKCSTSSYTIVNVVHIKIYIISQFCLNGRAQPPPGRQSCVEGSAVGALRSQPPVAGAGGTNIGKASL